MELNENFSYSGTKQNFDRDSYATLAEMKAVKAKKMPSIFHATCAETGKLYIYNKTNTDDEILGKWREVSGSSTNVENENENANGSCECEEDTDTIDFSTWPEYTSPEANGIVLDGQGGANIDDSNISVDPDDIEEED